MSRKFRTSLSLGLVMAVFAAFNLGLPGYSQSQPELRKLVPQFVGEPGCPVEVMAASTELEVDPFGTPVVGRHYIDYRNVSGAPIAAVKFRIGYVADDGKIHQPYMTAVHQHPLQPGGQASEKWKGDRVDPKTQQVKIRVLLVKMADGSVWESQKVGQTNAEPLNGFAPLTTEGSGSDLASGDFRAPGTPVPLTDIGKSYTGYPERTTTGPVNFNTTQTPAAGFDQGAFAAPGSAPVNPSPQAGSFAPFSGASAPQPASGSLTPGAVAPAFGAAPSAAAPASSAPLDSNFAAPTVGASPAVAPVNPTPAALPTATPSFSRAPAVSPAAVAQPIGDPVAELDKLMGNSAKPTTVATPTPAPAAAPAQSQSAPAPAPAQSAPSAAVPDPAPSVAPSAAGSDVPATTPAPQDEAPSVAPESAAPTTEKPVGGDDFAPSN